MKLYSSTFLNDSCLKYVGWMMYDKVISESRSFPVLEREGSVCTLRFFYFIFFFLFEIRPPKCVSSVCWVCRPCMRILLSSLEWTSSQAALRWPPLLLRGHKRSNEYMKQWWRNINELQLMKIIDNHEIFFFFSWWWFRSGWSPWPWIRTTKWPCRPWNSCVWFLSEFSPSTSLHLASLC